MTIIGLCGYKGSGKDTIADYLVDKNNFVKVAFADFIRNALKELFNWTDEAFSPENKEQVDEYWGVTPRKMCQEMGTEFLRIHCKDFISLDFTLPNGENYQGTFHIKRINQDIKKLFNENYEQNIIFSDIRFQDELDYIKKLGGIIIRVNRPDKQQNEFSGHISELNISNLNNVDIELINDTTINDLYKKIDSTVEHIEVVQAHQNH
jgi:adenylate kinase family enzyme